MHLQLFLYFCVVKKCEADEREKEGTIGTADTAVRDVGLMRSE